MMEAQTFHVRVYRSIDVWGDTAYCINRCGRNAIISIVWYEDSPGGQRSHCTVEICGECLKRVKNDELGKMLKRHRLEILFQTGFIINDGFFDNPLGRRLPV